MGLCKNGTTALTKAISVEEDVKKISVQEGNAVMCVPCF